MEKTKDNSLQYIMDNWQHMVKKYQTPNHTKATIQMITSFLPFIGVWILMYFSLSISYWLTLPLAFLNAFFLVRIFIIQHDCGHQSYFKSRKLNDSVGFICSFFSLIPYKYWAKAHNFHHGHNGRLEEDIRDIGDLKVLTVEEYGRCTPFQKMAYRVFRMPVILFGIIPVYYILINNRFPLIRLRGFEVARRSLVWSNLWTVGFYVACFFIFGAWTFLKIQIPIIAFFAIIAIWFFYVQHQHERAYKHWQSNWNYVLSAIQGSTYYRLPKVFQWLTGNIGLHHIHHLSSLIPNYNLETCKNENPVLQEHITIIGFGESLKCMFHKLWDEQQERMITFKEYRELYGKKMSY